MRGLEGFRGLRVLGSTALAFKGLGHFRFWGEAFVFWVRVCGFVGSTGMVRNMCDLSACMGMTGKANLGFREGPGWVLEVDSLQKNSEAPLWHCMPPRLCA